MKQMFLIIITAIAATKGLAQSDDCEKRYFIHDTVGKKYKKRIELLDTCMRDYKISRKLSDSLNTELHVMGNRMDSLNRLLDKVSAARLSLESDHSKKARSTSDSLNRLLKPLMDESTALEAKDRRYRSVVLMERDVQRSIFYAARSYLRKILPNFEYMMLNSCSDAVILYNGRAVFYRQFEPEQMPDIPGQKKPQ